MSGPNEATADPQGDRAALFRALVEQANDAILISDLAGPLIYANAAALALFGYAEDALLGKSVEALIAESDRSAFRVHRDATLKGGLGGDMPAAEFHGQPADGDTVPLRLRCGLVESAQGPVFACVLQDATAHRALAHTEAGFAALTESSPDCIAIARPGGLIYVNPASCQALGYDDPEELLAIEINDLVHPDDRAAVMGRISEVMAGKVGGKPQEVRMLRRDGSLCLWDVSSVAIQFQGAPAIVAISRDITERRQLEQRLAQADRADSMGTLAAGVAHEINNPLQYVVFNLETLSAALTNLAGKTPSADDVARMTKQAAQAEEGALRIAKIVRDLQGFVRAGDATPGAVDLSDPIEAAINIGWHEIKYAARLERDFADTPPVRAAESPIAQVVLNLLINAVHAIGDADAAMNVIRIRTWTEGSWGCFAVEDSGPGVSADTLPRIFDPFFTTRAGGRGSGLGLFVSQNIVSGFGGRIEIDPTVLRGARFVVRLPLWSPDNEVVSPRAKTPLPPVCGARILVVDDEPVIATLVQRTLESEHEVTSVTTAQGALDLVGSGELFDVILCDLIMPEMSGMRLYERLEETAPKQAARVVFMTGGAATEAVRAFVAATNKRVLAKPFVRSQLRDAIQVALLEIG